MSGGGLAGVGGLLDDGLSEGGDGVFWKMVWKLEIGAVLGWSDL